MNKRILFGEPRKQSLLRNGYVKTAGFGITFFQDSEGREVHFHSVRSNCVDHTGFIGIPGDPSLLRLIAHNLNELADEIEEEISE